MGSSENSKRDDLRYFENVQFLIVKLGLTVYSILGSLIIGLYSVALHSGKGITYLIQQSGLNLPTIANKIMWIGVIIGVVLFISSLLNYWRYRNVWEGVVSEGYGSKWSTHLNKIPVAAWVVIALLCFLYKDSFFTP